MNLDQQLIIKEYHDFLNNNKFPCIGAKTSIAKQQLSCMVMEDMACSRFDRDILKFLYEFIDDYRNSTKLFHSAAIIFKQPVIQSEEAFDELLWQKLQSLADIDSENYYYNTQVDNDPHSPYFSYSLMEEAFYIIGLHPLSSRLARQFKYPTLVFNPHSQFGILRKMDRYEHLKTAIRKRDMEYSGSINPMLEDFGKFSEVYQYSGRKYNTDWRCPLKFDYERNKHNPSS